MTGSYMYLTTRERRSVQSMRAPSSCCPSHSKPRPHALHRCPTTASLIASSTYLTGRSALYVSHAGHSISFARVSTLFCQLLIQSLNHSSRYAVYILYVFVTSFFVTLATSTHLFFFFLNNTAPPEISPLPQHDPLPI